MDLLLSIGSEKRKKDVLLSFFFTCLCTPFEPQLVVLCAKLQPVLSCELDLLFAGLLHSTALGHCSGKCFELAIFWLKAEHLQRVT